jgi:hypothetical protein
MVNDYSFLTKSQSTHKVTSGVDYSFLTRTTAPKETPKAPENVIKASDYKTVRLPLSLGGGEYITDKDGNLYLSERSQETLGGTLPGMERDHIVPVSLGGTSNKENLQYLESKPSFWQRIGGIFGKETSVQKSPNRQEGKLKVEQKAISGFQSGDLSVGEARLMVAMENMRIQGLSPSQKEMSVAGNLGKGIKDAFKTALIEPSVDLVKKMGQTIVGSLDFLHRTGLQVVSGVGTVVSPTIVSLSKFVGDDQLKNISYDEIWKEELEKGTKRMLDIGRPDEFFRAKINNDNYVPMMLFNDEIQSLAKSSNEKMDKGDVKGSVGDMFKIMGIKAMTDWANPFYAFAIKGVRFDPTKARGKVLWKGTFKQPVNQIGKAKEVQGVLRLEAQPQKIVEVIRGRVKTLKEPDIRIWMKTTKDGKISVDMRNVGGDILNKDLLKAVGETTTQPGVTPIMSLPVKLRPATVKPIKPVITPATVKPVITPTAPTPELQPLYNEAKKYKTADEFVNKQSTIYRGDTTPIKLSEMDTTKVFNSAEKEALSAFNNTPGLYFTDSVSNAKSYGKNLTSVSIKPTSKIINVNDAPKILKRVDVEKIIRSNPRINDWAVNWSENFDEAIKNITDSVMSEKDGNEFLKAIWADGGFSEGDFVNAMKKSGIDGIIVPKEGVNHFVIYNKEVLQTKSQLTDIWNKAQATIPTKPSIEPSFSRHYERIKEQYGFKDSVEFDRKTELAEKKKAFDFIQRSPEKALRIGYGYDEVPKGINQQVFRASLVASLNAQGKTALAQQVAKIQSSKMTEAAQTLAFGRVDIGTEAGIIKNITQARLEKIGKGLGVKEPEKRVEQARQVIERQAKDASKKVGELQKGKNTAKQLKEIDDLISSIIC